MCKTQIPQEDADHILAVGHKVTHQGQECVITSIRVWHDMGTLLGRPFRGKPVFDLKGDGWSSMNIPIDNLDLWFPPIPMPTATVVPPEGVQGDNKGHKQVKQSRAGPTTKKSG